MNPAVEPASTAGVLVAGSPQHCTLPSMMAQVRETLPSKLTARVQVPALQTLEQTVPQVPQLRSSV